ARPLGECGRRHSSVVFAPDWGAETPFEGDGPCIRICVLWRPPPWLRWQVWSACWRCIRTSSRSCSSPARRFPIRLRRANSKIGGNSIGAACRDAACPGSPAPPNRMRSQFHPPAGAAPGKPLTAAGSPASAPAQMTKKNEPRAPKQETPALPPVAEERQIPTQPSEVAARSQETPAPPPLAEEQ